MADFLEVLQNPQDSIHKSPRLLLDRLDSIAEEQIQRLKTEPLFELNDLLSLYLKISEFESYCKLFYQVEHLLTILEYSDRIQYYSLVMQILLRLFSKQKSNQKYLNEFVPRVVYLCRFFFDHSNSLCDQRMELYDYYQDDPIYHKLSDRVTQRSTTVQFMTPTLLLEPYEDLLKNQVHKLQLQQPPEQHIETALQVQCGSYRELSQKIIEANGSLKFCPLAELLKYKLLFFDHRDEVIELHLLALEVYLSLDQFCNDSPQQQDFLDTVFTEKIDFAHYFQVYAKLFQLQSTSALFLENVIRTFEGILTFDSMPEQDECFNIAKEYDETFLQLILDVLSQTPSMISPRAAKCEKVACRTLKLFSSEAGVALLARNTITVGTSQALIKALKQGSNLTLSPEVLRAAIKLLGRLSRKDDALFIDDILRMTESYLNLSRKSLYFNDIEITDAELLVSQCIQAINEHFKDEEGRRPRNNRVNAPNVARKVSETQILKQIHELLHTWDTTAFPPFLQQSLMLVSHVSNEVPTLIGRIMESKLPADLISLIQRWPISNVSGKQVEALFSFLSNITLKEEGFDAFNPIAMELFHNVLVRLITTQNTSQESLNMLASQFYKYVHKIDKASASLLKTLMAALNNILEQLKQSKFDINNYLIESKLEQAQESFTTMQHLLQNLSVFLTRITQVQQTHMSILHDLAHDGFVALLCQFLAFPNIEPRNDILRAFKALSQLDDTMIASNLLGLLGQQLSRVQVPVIADLSKYFNQQRDNFNKVCDYQYLEQLIEALKLTINIESHFEKTLLKNTIASLANKFIDFLPHIQETFTSVEQVQKNRIVNTLSSMKSVILAVYRQQKQQWNPDDCKDLVRVMTVLAEKMKGDASTMLVNSYLLRDISQTLVQSHRSGENGAIWVELYAQLIEAEFYNYAKAALGAFYQKLTRDEPLLDVIAQQFTRIVGNLYATKIEIKKGTPRDAALKVISQLVDELSYLVHICYDVEKECQQCLVEVLLSKCESLISYKDLIVDSQILRQSHMEDEDLENASEVIHHLVQLGYTQEQAQNAIDEIEEPELELALQYLQSQPLIKPSVVAEVESDRDREIKNKFAQLRILFNRYLLYFRHFDDKLHKLIDTTSILPQLLKALKQIAAPLLKLKFRDVDLTIAIPERTGLIPIILAHINRLSDRDFDHHELIRLLQELVKLKDDQSQSVTLILAMYHSSINNEELKKQRKKSKSDNIADHFAEALVVMNQTLRSAHTNSLNVRIATDVLVKILSLNSSYITQWVITLKGMDALLRQKGDDSNTVNVLSKLVFEITQDQTLQRAQLQCKIKRLLYDQEFNLEVEKEKEPVKASEKPHTEKQHPYPQVYQTLYHAVNLNELKIQKDAKELQGYLEEDLQFVVSKIFDEVTETVEEKQIVYYKLKPTSNLHTLEGVAAQYFIKYQPEQKKQSLSKKTVQLTQSNFQHTPEFQIMIKGLIQQIIISFLDQEKYQFHWFSILQVLHVLIRKYPLLIPKIMKVNCSKYCNEPKVLEALHITELPKISFLTFLVKVMIPSTQDKLKNFMFELCLDNVLLGQQSPTLITPFSAEIRKKILTEVYDQLEQEFRRNLFQSPTNSLAVASYSNMLIHLLQIKSVCRLAFRNVLDPQGSLNFIKLFMEAFKSLSLVGFYNYDKLLDFLTETLGVLYSVGIYNLTHNKPQKNPSSPNDGQPGQLRAEEIQHQVIPRQQIIYKDSSKVFDTWPYPPLAFACNRRDDIPDNYGFELQFIRGQNPLIHMQRNHRRPRGVVIDPLEGEDGEFLAVDSEMIQELHDPDQNSQQEQSFEEEGESRSQSQSQSEQHEGDSWVTSSNQSGQIQEEGSGSDSWTDEDEDEEGNDQMEEESNEDDQNESDEDNEDDNDELDEEDDLGSASGDEMDIDIDASLSGPVLIQKALPKEDQAYVKTIKTIVLFENIKFPTEFVRILDTLKEVFSVQFTEIITPTEIFITNWQAEFNKPSEEKPAASRFPHYFSHHFSHNSRINDLMRVTDLNRHRIFQPRQLLQTRIYNHAQQPLDNNAQQLQSQLLQLDWNTLLQNSVPQLAPQQPQVPPLNPLPEAFAPNLPSFQMPDFSGLLQQPAQGEFQNIFRNSPLNQAQQQQQQDRIQLYSQAVQMHDIIQLEQQQEQRRSILEQQQQQLMQQQQQLLAQQQQLLGQQQQLQQQQQQVQQLQPLISQQQQSLSSFFDRQVQQQQIQLQDLQIQEPEQQNQQQGQQMQEEVVVQQNQDQMQIEQPYPRTMELLSRLGRPVSQLTENGFDLEAFEQLPEDLQMDVIFSLPNQVENTNGIDIEFLNSLPHDIQMELQQQQRQPQNANPADDLLAFIQTLAPGLREEVLLTASNDVIEQLPQQIREEAMEIRMRANTREIYRLERSQYQAQPAQQQQQQQQQQKAKKDNQNLLKVKELLLKDKHLNHKLGTVDDEFAEALLNLLYLEAHTFVYFPINLFITLTNNPLVEAKIIDAMFFILRTKKDMPALKQSSNLREDQFPLTYIVERHGVMRDYARCYQIVSLKILYLLSKMQNISSSYFYEQRKISALSSIAKLSQEQQVVPIFQLIYLLPEFKGVHQDLLIDAISNLTRVKSDLQLNERCIQCMCQMLLQSQNRMKQFSTIISNLCSQESNLILFFQSIKEIIQNVTTEINQSFQASQDIDKIFLPEKSLINIFLFIKEQLERDVPTVKKQFQELLDDSSLQQLWKNLSDILCSISSDQVARQSSKIAPYLECFFIIYQMLNPQTDLKKRYVKKETKTKIATMEIQELVQNNDELFQQICERGKVLLNMMIKEKLVESRNTGKNFLQEPLGIVFLKAPKIIDFENKQKYFKLELKQLKQQNRHSAHGTINLRIRRKDIFMDSYNKFSTYQTDRLKGRLQIEFVGEEGIDAGGVLREWFLVLSREIFNPNYALFTPSLNGQMFQPSNKSYINHEHIKYFKFIGRIVGKALYDGQLLDTYFTRSFYKHILGQTLTIHDMEDIDLNEYNSMKKILENNIDDWGIYWTYNVDNFGRIEEKELVEGGKSKLVTDENKVEYVQTYCYQKMAKEIKDQIEAFLSGFQELIPQHIISIFEWKEMELMLCGLPDIDLDDMKENVEYHGLTSQDKIVQWLWELLESYDKSKRASYLQFVTGTSKVPLGGFKELRGMHGPQKMQIHKKPYRNFELPTSHTCFNQLDLPDYPTRQILKEKLELAILEGKEGFGFG